MKKLIIFFILIFYMTLLHVEAKEDLIKENHLMELMVLQTNIGLNLNAYNIDGLNNFADSTDTATTWTNTANSNNATLTNFTLPSNGLSGFEGANTAVLPSALRFDGVNDFLSLNSTGLVGNDSYTYEAWIKISSLPTNGSAYGLISIGDSSNEQTLGLANNFSSNTGFYTASSSVAGLNSISQNFLPAINTWYHLACIRNTSDGTLKLFVNGNEVASTSLSSSNAAYGTPIVRIGSRSNGNSFFNGLLAQSRVYSTALTANQILQNYLSEAYRYQGVDNVSPGIKGDDDFIGTNYKKAGDAFNVLIEDVNPTSNGDNDISAIKSLSCQLGNLALSNPSPQEINYLSGLTFDGNDDYLILNPISNFPTKEITSSFWIMTSNSGQGLISYASTSSDNDFLVFRAANLNVSVMGSSISTGVSLIDNKWHFVAVTWRSSDGEIRVYKDGVLSFVGNVSSGASITGGGSLVFGQDQNNIGGDFDPSQAFKGQLSNIQIYKRVLGQDEITSNYKFPYQIINPYGIIGFWRFDDSTVNNSSILNANGKKWVTSSNSLVLDSSLTSMLTNFDFTRSSGWSNQYSYNLARYSFVIPTGTGISQVEKLNCSVSDFALNTTNLELGGAFISRSNPQITTTFSQGNTLMVGDTISVNVSDNTPDTSILSNPTNVTLALDGNSFQNVSITPSIFSKALSLDGVDDYVSLGNQSVIRDVAIKTISFWTKLGIQTPVSQTNSYLVSKGDVWYIATDPGSSRNIFVHNFSGGNGKWSFPQFSTNTWHHVAVVYDKQSASNDPLIYVDGVLQPVTKVLSPSGVASSDASFNLYLSKSESSSAFVNGVLDDFQLYSRGLAQEEISLLLQNPGKIINPKNLISWLRFDKLEDIDSNSISDNLRDYSGNSNHGTLVTGTTLAGSIVSSEVINSIDGVSGTVLIPITNSNPTGPNDIVNKNLTVTTSNANGISSTDTKTVTLLRNRAPQNPVIVSSTINGVEAGSNSPYVVKNGETFIINFSALDPDTQDMISLSTPVAPTAGVFSVTSSSNPGLATYTFTPGLSHIGMTYTFTVKAQDNYLASSSQELTISVVVVQNPATLASPTPSPSPTPQNSPTPSPTITPSPTPSPTPKPTATPTVTSSPVPSATPIPTSSINLNSLPDVNVNFPALPDLFADSFGLGTDALNQKNIIIAGSPASFTVDAKSQFATTYLNNFQSGQEVQLKIIDSKNQEFTITATLIKNPSEPDLIYLNTSKVPSEVLAGSGSVVYMHNGIPSAKINVFVIRSQTLTDSEIQNLQPTIDSVVIIRRTGRVKFVVLGKNFFRKKIIIGGNKEINTGKMQTSISVIPNTPFTPSYIRILKGGKVIVARYSLKGDKVLPEKVTVRVVNPYGQILKVVDVPLLPATGNHERKK